jgi:hypothetical protein
MRTAVRRRRQAGRSLRAAAPPPLAGIAADIETAPPPERGRHDRILPPDQTIADERGSIGRPFRVVDTLGKMLAAGTIDERMQAAGDRFRDDFDRAHLHGLRAADLTTPRVDNKPRADAAVTLFAPRERVWRAMQAAGGMTSAGGSCLWHVIGEGCSLAEWAMMRQAAGRRMNKDNASGVLVAALDAVATLYAGARR